MNSTRHAVGQLLSTAESENLLSMSQPTIVTRRDNSVKPEGLRTISQSTTVGHCDNSNILTRNTSNSNIQSRGKGNAGTGASQNMAMPADSFSISKSSKSISSQDVATVHVVASKVLHEKQCISEGPFCSREAAAESVACPSPARSALERLGLSCCIDDANAVSPPSARLFSDLENENPARIRRDEFFRHSLDSIPTPRAPTKPTRVKSLNTLFPGKTRRRLDFDHV